MGDWMTVQIEGTCDAADVPVARDFFTLDCVETHYSDREAWKRWGPLSWSPKPSLCGLHDWVRETISQGGNCAERDFSPQCVAEQLDKAAAIAPSLRVKVHCGGPYESEECVATVTLDENGATVGPPEVETVSGVSQDAITARFRMLGLAR